MHQPPLPPGNTRSEEKEGERETNPTALEPRVGGGRQTDGYRTSSDLSQCYKAHLNRFTQYSVSSNTGMFLSLVRKCQTAKVNKLTSSFLLN